MEIVQKIKTAAATNLTTWVQFPCKKLEVVGYLTWSQAANIRNNRHYFSKVEEKNNVLWSPHMYCGMYAPTQAKQKYEKTKVKTSFAEMILHICNPLSYF